MRDFYKMSFTEINQVMGDFQLQIMRQQAKGISLTEKQMKYYKALSKAFQKINQEVAK